MNAKVVTVGNLTFHVRPRTTLGIYTAIDEMETLLGKPSSNFGFVADNFLTSDYNTISLEHAGELTEDESVLVEYFSKRNGSITYNWGLAQDMLTVDALRLWSRAVQSTRAPLSDEKKDS